MTINLHATTTIDVHDQNFRQFVQNFNQFQQNLNQVPRQWQNVQRSSIMATVQMQQATSAMMQNVSAATTRLGTFSSNLQKVGYQFKTNLVNPMNNFFARVGNMMWSGGGPAPATGGGAVARQQAAAGGAAAQGGVPAGAPGPRGTFGRGAFAVGGANRLFRRLGIGGFVSGILGGGSLYGLERLSSGAQNARQSYLGMGTDYGTLKSYDLAYAGLFSGKEYLANIARAQGMPTGPQAQALYGLGLNPQLGNTNSLAKEALQKLRSETKGLDPFQLGLYYQGRQLQGMFNFEDVRRISSISDKEFSDRYTKQAEDAQKLGMTDDSVKAWADLNQSLKTSGEIMKKGFLEGLEGSTTGLGRFSKALSETISDMLRSQFTRNIGNAVGSISNLLAHGLESAHKGTFWKDLFSAGSKHAEERRHSANPEERKAQALIDRVFGFFGSATSGNIRKSGHYDSGQMMKDATSIAGSVHGGISGAINNAGNWLNRNVFDPIKDFKIGKGPSLDIATPNLAQSDNAILKTLMGLEADPRLGYNSLGKVTPTGDRAYGMYQIMGNNIRSWTRKWLNKEMTPSEFLADPRAQDTVALGQFKEYMQAHGGSVTDALAMWKSGQPFGVSQNWNDPTAGDNVRSYVQKGIGIYNNQPGVGKIDINIYPNTGSGTSANVNASAVPPGIMVNAY